MWLDAQGYKKAARESLGRQNEVIADKFAGVYGYWHTKSPNKKFSFWGKKKSQS